MSPDIGEEVHGWNEDVKDEEEDNLTLVLLPHQVHAEAHSEFKWRTEFPLWKGGPGWGEGGRV